MSALLQSLLDIAPFLGNVEVWKYASIPVVAGLVGWGTNWAAIELTFKPLRFIGIRPFLGWQGIIPSKAARMASIFVDSTMIKLGTLPELFQQMEPDVIAGADRARSQAAHAPSYRRDHVPAGRRAPGERRPRRSRSASTNGSRGAAAAGGRTCWRRCRSGSRSCGLQAPGGQPAGERSGAAQPPVPRSRVGGVQVHRPLGPLLRLPLRPGAARRVVVYPALVGAAGLRHPRRLRHQLDRPQRHLPAAPSDEDRPVDLQGIFLRRQKEVATWWRSW